MAIKKRQPAFVTQDGREWEDEEDANRWEDALESKEKLDDALGVFQSLLCQMHKTADSERFDLSQSRDYFRIVDRYPSMPMIERVSVWPSDLQTIDRDYKEPGFKVSIRFSIGSLNPSTISLGGCVNWLTSGSPHSIDECRSVTLVRDV